MRPSARSFWVFVGVYCVSLASVSLEILELVLKLVSLWWRAKTPTGYLSFSFRFELWNRLICPGYQSPISIAFANVHLIKDFKCICALRVDPIRVFRWQT